MWVGFNKTSKTTYLYCKKGLKKFNFQNWSFIQSPINPGDKADQLKLLERAKRFHLKSTGMKVFGDVQLLELYDSLGMI